MKFYNGYVIILFLSHFLFSIHGLKAQNETTGNNKLSGRVLDGVTKQPLDFVNITLFTAKDSVPVTGGISNIEGLFSISNIPRGGFYARLKFIGFEEKIISDIQFKGNSEHQKLGDILLENADNELSEVVVEAEQKMLETSIDKKVFNVEEDLSTRGGTANDVLSNVPSIDIDQDGQISLRGNSNVTVLIDGRPSSLSGSSRGAILDAIPAASIERVEVVTNPSAKYDPDGMSGIINIVLKKNKLRGFNGNIDGTYGTGNNYTTAVGVNLRNDKFNVFANYSYRYYDGYRNFFSDRERELAFGTEFLSQERYGRDNNNGHTGKAGFDYRIKDNHIIGMSATGSYNKRTRDGLLSNTLYLNGVKDSVWQRNSSEPRTSQSFDLNLNYQWTFKEKKGEMIADFNQSWGKNTVKGYYDEYDLMEWTTNPARMEQLDNPTMNTVFSGLVDIVRNFKNAIRLETGAKAIVNTDDRTQFREIYDFETADFYPDTNINNRFKLTEQIYAVYGIFGHQVKKFKYQLGIRLEQALVRPELITTGEKFKNDYFSFFPSAHLAYELKKKGELFLSYSRRINRPSSWNLNPFTEYSDPFNLRMGNPALKPEYINSFEVGYNKSWKKLTVNATGYYRHSTDVIQRVRTYYPDGTAATVFDNLDKTMNYGVEGIMIYRPWDWWRTNFSTNVYQSFLITSNPELQNNSGLNWGFKLSSAIDFWKKTTTFQLNYRYNAPRVVPQGLVQYKPAIDLSLQRQFLDKKLSVTLRISDVFDWQGFYMLVENQNVWQESEYKWQSRRLFLTVSYRFGKLEVGNDSRRRRGSSGNGSGGDMDF